MPTTTHLHVLTGGPGSGKTTLIDALAAEGIATVPEAGRAIIRDQMAIGGRAVPWDDPALYAELMLARDLAAWRTAQERDGPVVFDRGVVDIAGYLTLIGRPVPDHLLRAIDTCRYAPTVFIAPPWPEIYGTDTERKQDWAEAVATHDAMVETYTRHGYTLIPLPKTDLPTRRTLVRRHLKP
jgi:predicted ATPase